MEEPGPPAPSRSPFRLFLVLGVLPLLLVASLLVVYRERQADRIYPGVSVLGIRLGRLTQEQAAGAIKRHLIDQSRQPFLLRYDDSAFTVTLAALGLKIDDGEIADTASRAWQIGRKDELRPWLHSQLELLRTGHTLPTTIGFNSEQAATLLRRVAGQVERETVNAGISVEKAGERFEIHTTPAQMGRRLNVPATLERLQSSSVSELPNAVDLVLDEAPPSIVDADVLPAIQAIEVILSGPLEFRDGARRWALEPAAALAMLEITGLDLGHPPVGAKLNEAKLRDFVEGVARSADQPARNPTFDVQGNQVVVQRGTTGKLADAAATFDLAKASAASTMRTLEIVFTEDKPWLTEADLEPARTQTNALLDLPITLETPPVSGIQPRKWVLDRAVLAQMLVLPNTQAVSRSYPTLPPAQQPKFEIQLDSGKVTNFLAREVAPWVSEDPVNAELVLKTMQVDVEARKVVELHSAKEGRGPDYLGTFAGIQTLFRSGVPSDPAERLVAVRLAARPVRVRDRELEKARDTANLLIGEPVTLRMQGAAWVVTRDELAGMLRYQPSSDGLMAYLTRDGLLAKATAVAREAERQPGATRSSTGQVLPVDVAATAAVIWHQASTVPVNRTGDIVWTEEEVPAPESTTTTPGTGRGLPAPRPLGSG